LFGPLHRADGLNAVRYIRSPTNISSSAKSKC
jgi:hypothetical protein